MASELAIYFTPMHFMWGVKSGATLVTQKNEKVISRRVSLARAGALKRGET